MATNNSGDISGPGAVRNRRQRPGFALLQPRFLACLSLLLMPLFPALRGEDMQRVFANRARTAFDQTRTAHGEAPTNQVKACAFARACFDLAEFATNDTQRATLAQQGIQAAREAITAAPEMAEAHYYLGMNLGQLARTQTLGALKLVNQMEASFTKSKDLDPKFDFAGPDRCLGLLYLDAPGWPASIGDKRKARLHLEQALAIAPDYPDNRLNLLEALVRWKDRKKLPQALAATEQAMQEAKSRLTGEVWEASWLDWSNRLGAVRARIKERKLIQEKD